MVILKIMEIKDLEDAWDRDNKIDLDNLVKEHARVPQLYNIWNKYRSWAQLKYDELKREMVKLEFDKTTLYYIGYQQGMPAEWKLLTDFKPTLNAQKDQQILADPDMLSLQEKIDTTKEIVRKLDGYMDMLKFRSNALKYILDQLKYDNPDPEWVKKSNA